MSLTTSILSLIGKAVLDSGGSKSDSDSLVSAITSQSSITSLFVPGGNITSIISGVLGIINRIFPDKTEEMKLKYALAIQREINSSRLLEAQIELNKAEIELASQQKSKWFQVFFVGWRSVMAWLCILALFQFSGVMFLSLIGIHLTLDPNYQQFITFMNNLVLSLLGVGTMSLFSNFSKDKE